MDLNEFWLTTPTISNEFPLTTTKTHETEFDLVIHEDDYRQYEFLNANSFQTVQGELANIMEIWNNHSKNIGDYIVFSKCHVRDQIGSPDLNINYDELKKLLGSDSLGQVIINGEILVNGFTIRTNNTTYFGILNGNTIIELCLDQWNNDSNKEIIAINRSFNLLFVNWFHYKIVTND